MTTTQTAALLATLQKASDLLHELRAHDLTDPDSESTMAEIEAALAGQAIPPSGETETEPMLTVSYECPHCGECWDEQWTSACNSDCGNCGQGDVQPLEWRETP
jgi:hypothetical protein